MAKSNAKGKRKAKSDAGKRQAKKTSTAQQHVVVDTFARGLSHQIPPDSLSHIANSSDSIRLLLEKSTESLPMGSSIRKAVGENFALCVETLTREVELRLREQQRALAKTSEKASPDEVKEGDVAEVGKFAVFSPEQYEGTLEKLLSNKKSKDGPDAAEEDCRKLLVCTNFATSDVMFPLDNKNKPSAEGTLDAFRSATLSGQIKKSTVGGYVTRMVFALRGEVDDNPRHIAGLIRDFMGCFAMAGCAKNSALMSQNNGKIAFQYGELLGLLVFVGLSRPIEYYSDSGRNNSSDSDSSSDSEEDVEPRQDKRLVEANVVRDLTCNLTILLMGVSSAAPHIVGGIISCIKAKLSEGVSEKNGEVLMQKASIVLVDALIKSSVVAKSLLPSTKLVKSGDKRFRMIQQWSEGVIKKVTRETFATTKAKRVDGGVPEAYDSSESDDDSNEESSEDDGDEEQEEELASKEDQEQEAPAPDESLFVIDAAPVDDGDEIESDQGEKEPDVEADEPAEIKVMRGVSRPPRPPTRSKAKSKDVQAIPAPAPAPARTPQFIRSTRSRSRGDSLSSLPKDTDKVTSTPTRRSTRSRSMGESINSAGSMDMPTRRSARVRSRGDSMSQA